MENSTTQTLLEQEKVRRIADGVEGYLQKFYRDGEWREVRFIPLDGSECKRVQSTRATAFPFARDDSALKACMAEFECVPIEIDTPLQDIVCCQMVDFDLAGENIVGCYVEAQMRCVSKTEGVSFAPLGDFSDESLSAPYTPVNGMPFSDVGDDVRGEQLRSYDIAGPSSWSFPNLLLTSFNIKVKTVADEMDPPQLVMANGTQRPLCPGETISMSTDSQDASCIICNPPGLVLNSGDHVIVDTTEFCTE